MTKLPVIILLLILPFKALPGQVTFPEMVDEAFGSDQELVNGIQFSNHYGRIDGHPYFQDESFRSGTVYLTDQLYEHLKLRYNLYTQKVEIEYQFPNGSLIQFMSVPEHMPSFTLEGRKFVRMQFGNELPAYYQLVSSGETACYIAWKKEMNIARNDSFNAYQFSAPMIRYWLKLGQQLTPFHNRKTFVESFPEQIQSDILLLLKQRRYSFRTATVHQAEEMILATLRLYELHVLP